MNTKFLIVFFACLCLSAQAQFGIHPLSWHTDESLPLSGGRTLSSVPHVDTLKIPFIHDFFTINIPIDSLRSSTDFANDALRVYTHRIHGLKTGDTIIISGVKAPYTSLNGEHYIDSISRYSFDVYTDENLTVPYPAPDPLTDTIEYARIQKKHARQLLKPDTLAFYDNNGGVTINPGFAKNQLSYYIASFDGLNEAGVPYDPLNPLARGYTDELRSQFFDLEDYDPADSIYLSFHYQHGGLGEIPDLNDFLYLEFRDNAGNWNTVWSAEGGQGDPSDVFIPVLVGLKDPIYLHDGFQFRFRSYGRMSGSYDIWNLDYIYLDQGRSILASPYTEDLTIRNADESILENYTAMPYRHFFTNQAAFLKPNLSMTIINQGLLPARSRNYLIELNDNFGNTVFSNLSAAEIHPGFETVYTDAITYTITDQNQPIYINQTYSISDVTVADLFPFDFMFNNVLARRTILHDFYAYDDAGAEFAVGGDAGGTQAAVRFQNQALDTLTDIDIAFVRSKGPNVNGLRIFLRVWDSGFNLLRSQQIQIAYHPTAINGYMRYKLNNPIILSAGQTYHIGYQQGFNQLLTLGYDMNNDHTDKVFFNTSGAWQSLDNEPGMEKGSMMIRPVFSKGEIMTSVKKDALSHKLELYPNPASHQLHVATRENLDYQVFSLIGQLVASGTVSSSENGIDIQHLSSGMYIVFCKNKENKTYTGRFIKE